MRDDYVDKAIAAENAQAIATLVYTLQLISFVTAIPMFVAVIVNYIKFDEVRGTLAESHFRWQMNTFWFALLWTIVGFCTMWLLIGFVIFGLIWLWSLYRVVRGWLDLASGQPMYR